MAGQASETVGAPMQARPILRPDVARSGLKTGTSIGKTLWSTVTSKDGSQPQSVLNNWVDSRLKAGGDVFAMADVANFSMGTKDKLFQDARTALGQISKYFREEFYNHLDGDGYPTTGTAFLTDRSKP